MAKTKSYSEAADRLDEIVRIIEQDSPDVDELTRLVAEAVELTKYCRAKLTEADKQLQKLMEDLQPVGRE